MEKKDAFNDLQKEASSDVKSGQFINASDMTPHPFSSSNTIDGASMLSVFSLGHIPRLRDRRPTCKKRLRAICQMYAINDLSESYLRSRSHRIVKKEKS